MSKVFYLDPHPTLNNWYIIQNHLDEYEMPMARTTYHHLIAHLVGMDYESYLTFCSDCLGAWVVRKDNAKYASIYLKNIEVVNIFVDILNRKFKESYELYQKH